MVSGIYMYPDRYPTAVCEWEFIPAIHPLKLPVQHIGQFYPQATTCGEGNGILQFQALLSVATFVRLLWYLLSRVVL